MQAGLYFLVVGANALFDTAPRQQVGKEFPRRRAVVAEVTRARERADQEGLAGTERALDGSDVTVSVLARSPAAPDGSSPTL